MALHLDWQTIIAIISFGYLSMEFVVEKGFGKKAFLASIARWCWKMMNRTNEIMHVLEQQNKEYLEQAVLIYQILQKVEKIEKEVKYNGGSVLLADAVKDIKNNLAIFASEEEAKMYLDPVPMFKTEPDKGVTFCNAAYLNLLGATHDYEVIGTGYMDAIPEENKKMVEKKAEQFAKNPVPFHADFTYQHLVTKKLIHTNVRTQLITDENKKVVATIGTVILL